jgi:EAL domain-containing protein (putative c-di-GMP-specific phosphodiesterase class I)
VTPVCVADACAREAGVRLMQGYLFGKPAFRSLAQVDDAARG